MLDFIYTSLLFSVGCLALVANVGIYVYVYARAIYFDVVSLKVNEIQKEAVIINLSEAYLTHTGKRLRIAKDEWEAFLINDYDEGKDILYGGSTFKKEGKSHLVFTIHDNFDYTILEIVSRSGTFVFEWDTEYKLTSVRHAI